MVDFDPVEQYNTPANTHKLVTVTRFPFGV